MKRLFFFAFFLMLAGSVLAADRISIVRLLSNGEKYEGKRVIVSGFLAADSTGVSGIYLDEDSAKAGVTVNSIALDLGRAPGKYEVEKLMGKYVQLDGYFWYSSRDDRYGGGIKEIGNIKDYPLVKPRGTGASSSK